MGRGIPGQLPPDASVGQVMYRRILLHNNILPKLKNMVFIIGRVFFLSRSFSGRQRKKTKSPAAAGTQLGEKNISPS